MAGRAHSGVMTKHALNIEGMSCDHCVRAVKAALEAVEGVTSAEVRVGHADVQAAESTTREALAAAITEEGFTVAA